MRGAGSSFGRNDSSSSIDGGGTGIFRLITVTSPGSSSSSAMFMLSLGISMNFGSSSSISGVPSFIQKRRISSSYRVSHVGQYFISRFERETLGIYRNYAHILARFAFCARPWLSNDLHHSAKKPPVTAASLHLAFADQLSDSLASSPFSPSSSSSSSTIAP